MDRLEQITIDDLQEQLARTDERVPTQRILAAIAYKQGESKQRLARRHDVTRKTIDNWMDRFVDQPIEHAPYDEPLPGRPPELTEAERTQLFADLECPPETFGYDRHAWDPPLVARHLERTYDVAYSLRHVRRLMADADRHNDTAQQQSPSSAPEKTGTDPNP